MNVTRSSSPVRVARAPLVRRTLTGAGTSAFELVEWSERSVQITARDGSVAFACDDIEAPLSWSNLAVAVVARRYFAHKPGAAPERSVGTLVERVVGAIASWAEAARQTAGAEEPASSSKLRTRSPSCSTGTPAKG
jgi:hypothetical protein